MNGNRKIQYFRFVIAYNVVMLIPLALISFCVLYLFHKQQQQKINDEMVIVMERQEELLNPLITDICSFQNSSCLSITITISSFMFCCCCL